MVVTRNVSTGNRDACSLERFVKKEVDSRALENEWTEAGV